MLAAIGAGLFANLAEAAALWQLGQTLRPHAEGSAKAAPRIPTGRRSNPAAVGRRPTLNSAKAFDCAGGAASWNTTGRGSSVVSR